MSISASSSYDEVIRELCEFKGFGFKEHLRLGRVWARHHFFIYEKDGVLFTLDFVQGTCSRCDLLEDLLSDFWSENLPREQYDNLQKKLFQRERTLFSFLYEDELAAFDDESLEFREWVLNSDYAQQISFTSEV